MTTLSTGEPTSLEELRAEFPDWIIDRGLSGRYYAWRPRASPILSGEDLLDLRDQVLGWVRRQARQEQATVGRVRSLACTWCRAPAGDACDPQADTDHLLRYARARHAGLITTDEHADARPGPSPDGGAPMVTAAAADE
jgi:hypothetical protein